MSKIKLKVAQVTPYYYPSIGGVQGVAKYIAEGLAELGHDVDVITAFRDHKGRPAFNVPRFEILNKVKIYRYRSLLNVGHMSYMPGLVWHLLKYKYDVIHYHSYRHPLCDISALIGKIRAAVTVLHSHGPFFEKGEIPFSKKLIYDIYDRFASFSTLKWTNKIIVFNEWEVYNFKKLGVKNEKSEFILNAADEEAFNKYNPKPFLEEHNLQGKKIILCMGILNSAKRQDLLIEALPLILKEVPNAFLVLAGPDGGLLETINKKAKTLNVVKYFKHIGPVYGEEKHIVYEAAHVFALTSDKDAYPLVIAEAMAHHLPVIATQARGPKVMVHNNYDGILVKIGDVQEIAQAIIKLLKDEELRKTMGENARKNAEENHCAMKSVKKLENLYYQLLKK